MAMPHDPIEHMADEATQKMLANEEITEREFQAVLFQWSVRRIQACNQELAETLTNNNDNGGKMATVKRHGPSAGAGFGLASVLAFLREFLMGGGG